MIAALLAIAAFTRLPLSQAESRGVGNAPDVAIAAARVAEEQALFDQARAAYGPAVTVNYALAPQGTPQGTIEQRLTTVGAQTALGDVIEYSPLVAQAEANVKAAQFDYANAVRAERIRVIQLYFSALSSRAVLTAKQGALHDALAQRRAAQLRFSAGDTPRLDVVRANVAVAQARATVAEGVAQQRSAYADLSVEVGADPAVLAQLSEPLPSTSQPLPDVNVAIETALQRRPEVPSARASVTAERRAVQAAKRLQMPPITLSAGYTKGVDSGFPVSGPSATAQLTFPLGGSARYHVAAEEARLRQTQAQQEKIRRQIVTEVGNAVRAYQAQAIAASATSRALSQATVELHATELGYRSGASSSLDVENARATYVQALVTHIAAQYSRIQAQATLQLLMGP